MHRLFSVSVKDEIFPEYKNTPVGLLLEYHNLGMEHEPYTQAQLLIGMCMDNRKHLHIPDNFAYIIRAGGANLRYSEFKVSYAIAVGGVKCIALIGHNQCGMVNLMSRREIFIKGLVENRLGTRTRGTTFHELCSHVRDRQEQQTIYDHVTPKFKSLRCCTRWRIICCIR